MTMLKKRLSGSIAAIGLMIGVSGPVNAAYIDYTWEDSKTWNNKLLSEWSDGYAYSHNISEYSDKDAYRPGIDELDWNGAWVKIWLSDDQKRDGREEAEVYLDGLFGYGWGGGGEYSFSLNFEKFNLNILGWLDLRQDGKIGIYIEPTEGDFYLRGSLLHATGKRKIVSAVAVPEPGTLALLAIGLIGMGVALSRRRNQKK